MGEKPNFAVTKEVVREIRERGLAVEPPKHMTPEQWQSAVYRTDRYVEDDNEDGRTIARSLHVTHQAISRTVSRTLRVYWERLPVEIQERLPQSSMATSKPIRRDVIIQRHRSSHSHVLERGLREGKTLEEIEKESGKRFRPNTRKLVRGRGVDVPLTPREASLVEYAELISKIVSEKDPQKLEEYYKNKRVNLSFLAHHSAGEDPIFITLGRLLGSHFGYFTLLKGKRFEDFTKVAKQNGVVIAEAHNIDQKGRVKNSLRVVRVVDLNNEEFMKAVGDFVDNKLKKDNHVKREPILQENLSLRTNSVGNVKSPVYFPPVVPFWKIKTLEEIRAEMKE
ncbi:MAG TPA: hypothetical protein VG917_01955 [Patescibacteria group bacterium]|nr:hypothetical protein [Patescibacteria group bacterium]